MDRKERAELHYNLIKLLTECETDDDFFKRLIIAQKIIAIELEKFLDKN